MMTEEQVAAPAITPKLQMHKAADFKSLYVNWVQTSITPFDISLVVGEAVPVDQTTFDVEQKARINFHPIEAKVIAVMLAQALENYETQFGEVTVPSGQVQMVVGEKEVKEKNTEGI